jgi:hypothetical protein
MYDGLGWTIDKSKLVEHDEQTDALKRFQEAVLNPVLNSAVVEPWNTVAGAANSISEKLHGPPLISHKADFQTKEAQFLSTPWLVESVASGLAMLIPYGVAGKFSHGTLKAIGSRIEATGMTARILENEASAQILGAAMYDGLRETKQGETHLGNAVGGVTAFSTFAIGNALSKDLPLGKMLAMRTLAGAIGGTAQHEVSAYMSNAPMPSLKELSKSGINGIVMSMVLPESQRFLHSSSEHGHEHFEAGVPIDRLTEIRTAPQVVAHAPVAEELSLEHIHAPATYDFFIKAESATQGAEHERTREEMSTLARRTTIERGFNFSTNIPHDDHFG